MSLIESVPADITYCIEPAIAVWNNSSSGFPEFAHCYSRREQRHREESLDRSLDIVERELWALRHDRMDTEAVLSRVTTAVVEMACCALDFKNPGSESVLRNGFSQIGMDLARSARALDPSVAAVDILQACRNAWTACGLQLLFGHDMRLTPAIFAYSMLYPYSDNYLDDPAVSNEAKLLFSARFRCRLRGEPVAALGKREAIVWELIGLLESEYPRAAYPDVFDSLLAIHAAQQQSLAQMAKRFAGADCDILKLSVTKGGSSVLADAFLVRGSLTQAEAEFAFDWGVLLQLCDDLQDLPHDSRAGALTLFTQAAGRGVLDRLTNRTFHFGAHVMERMVRLPNAPASSRELLEQSWLSLLFRSAANLPDFYSRSYLNELESHSAFSFAFLRDREKRLNRRTRTYLRAFEALLMRFDPRVPVMLPARAQQPECCLPLGL